MSQNAGIKIKRNNIVEVGSLATANSVVGRLVIPILSDAVLAQGFAWVALTATDALIHFLHELHHFFFRKTPIMFNESEHVLSSLDVLSLVNYRNLI